MKKLLVIGLVWPEPKGSAAGSRLLQLIGLFKSSGCHVTFASTSKKSPNRYDLSTLDVEEQVIALNDSSFDEFIKGIEPDIVLFDRFMSEEQFGWRVAEHCPKALRILDTEDFHGLRKAREEAVKQGTSTSMAHLQNDTTKREIASIYRCDLSLIISEAEMEILTQDFKIDSRLLHYVPFLLDFPRGEQKKGLPVFEERQHFITIGNFLHAPNADAVHYLKSTVWPLIRKQLPKAELHIYGAYPSLGHLQMTKATEGFHVKGYVDDVHAVMQKARVCLAPLRFGAGLKGKLIDAMVNGTPCMMSSIAAEGMFG
ncbi:MAG: glycosyltransferase family 4 protein, partial [Bacteroidota bacterium]